jgi:hypothetical protein
MLKRFHSFDPIAATGDAMLENKEQIIGINQEMLYEDGTDVFGNVLKPYSWQEYAEYKFERRGKGITDLYDTGAMYSRMNLRVDGNEYEINSSDEKAFGLVKKYGKIFGLTELGKKETWVIIKPDFVYNLKQVTQTT